ncbi:hypothetical protein [uncultured Polaribacter sp.]|uniref:hypothetical protein n=1 Tax=uncultured Polaribacter sp. TaxID=174711 RepID=UPI0026319CBE|nr:hypothetical protein [uncultured Polaribacter sp.]
MKYVYSFIIIVFLTSSAFSQDIKNEKEVSFIVIEKAPVFPGCKGSNKKLKQCFNESIQKLFSENFNIDLANQLGLAGGEYRVFIGFKITHKGTVKNILVRAPHKKIKEEVKRVMHLIPQMIPGEVKGEKVGVKYSIPFTMFVEETKAQKKARRKNKKN